MDTFVPASAILPLPTTRSSYWSPLASLCTLPPLAGAPGSAGVVAASLGVVVTGVVAVAVVLCSDLLLVFSLLSLQPTRAVARARPRTRNGFDMEGSFPLGQARKLAYRMHLRKREVALRTGPQARCRARRKREPRGA